MTRSETDADFYTDLDQAKNQGRGSCCTTWSFFLLLGMLLVLGLLAVLFI